MQQGTDAAPNPGLIFDTLLAHQRSAALRTAIELDVFRAVGEGPADAATLAARCATSQRGMRILCDFLTIILQGRTDPMRVLDIAAGHGLFGIAIARQNPQAHIVALDWARVLDVACENAAKAGVADRYQRLPGSAFEVDYGGPYDAVLLS